MSEDQHLIERLRRVARWLQNEGAHRPAPEVYREFRDRAEICRKAATRLEQLLEERPQ